MPRVALNSGAYQARSLIANAQRCVNLFPEANPGDASPPVAVTHYQTAGTRRLVQGAAAPVRGLYAASSGDLYAAIGSTIHYVGRDWSLTSLGTIRDGTSPVVMSDNGTSMLIVDGTENGYIVDLASRAMTQIDDEAFYGADRVEYLKTFFVLNKPDTGQFYCSASNGTTFDGLDVASKTGAADKIATLAVVHSEVRLLGTRTTEVWATSGDVDFPFAPLAGAFIDSGCAAKHSVARQGPVLFWLAQNDQGDAYVIAEASYQPNRVSTHALEDALRRYPVLSDARGYCFQQGGHAFYVLTFPTADKTWVYDLETKQWHEWVWTDENGAEHRHRSNCHAFAYGENVVGDHANGCLYALDPDVFTDDGQPIVRRRGFPHIGSDGRRISYDEFLADVEVGTTPDIVTATPPVLSLRYSDTRGASWGNPVQMPMGASGEHNRVVKFTRLGMARDRVFEVFWSAPVRTALNGAVVSLTPGSS